MHHFSGGGEIRRKNPWLKFRSKPFKVHRNISRDSSGHWLCILHAGACYLAMCISCARCSQAGLKPRAFYVAETAPFEVDLRNFPCDSFR